MSERADQARADEARLTTAIFHELVELVDASIPDQLLMVTIEERRRAARHPEQNPYYRDDYVIGPLVERVIAELDDDDLSVYVVQEATWLLRRQLEHGQKWARRREPSAVRWTITLEDNLRATAERHLTEGLRKHLCKRAAEFMPRESAA